MKSYQISREGQVLGEFVEAQIQEGLQTGYFRPSDWCWSDGMAEWQGVGAVFPRPQPMSLPFQPLAEPDARPVDTSPVDLNPYAAPKANGVRRIGSPAKKLIEPASLGSRFVAAFIDSLSLVVWTIPVWFVGPSDQAGSVHVMLFVMAGLFLMMLVLNVIYLVSNGQTIGKKMAGIRIVRMDGGDEKASFFRIVFLRSFVAQGLLGIIPLWNLIDILFIFGEERRCLHDKIADTQVINA